VTVFSDPRIIQLLQKYYVPVAIDQANERRQDDAEGDFYQKIASQGPKKNFDRTTQGFYIATPDGKLLHYSNSHSADFVYKNALAAANVFNVRHKKNADFRPIKEDDSQDRWNITRPEGVVAVRVQARVLGGYEEPADKMRAIKQASISRDNLWITSAEIQQLARQALTPELRDRIIRFHLVDNTRGEPPNWSREDIRKAELTLEDGILQGEIELENAAGDRGYHVKLQGLIEAGEDQLQRFDLLAFGQHWGAGKYNRNPPAGKFPLVVAFTLADGRDIADEVPPWAARGYLPGYLNP